MARPRSCECGECATCRQRAKSARWAARHPGYAAEVQRRRRESGVTARYENHRYATDPAYRQRKIARAAVNRAIAQGRLIRQPCEACGTEPAEAHHADYSRKLDVRWLCTEHHAAEHVTP